jgi:uncharacterized protein
MKFVLLMVAVLALVWLVRSASTRRVRPPGQSRANPPHQAQPMLACALCGLHLPRDEALPGRGGVFCSEAHRTEFERSPPRP